MPTKADVLREVFGYRSFRGGQEPLVDAVLDGRDVMAVMPTGAGKSLCFQVPALMLSGITIVVSPPHFADERPGQRAYPERRPCGVYQFLAHTRAN